MTQAELDQAVPLEPSANETSQNPTINQAQQERSVEALPATELTTLVGHRREFSAHLDGFQGPLDLLLYLIKANEVDVVDIPISTILDQYLEFMEQASTLDPHIAGEFLVMVTTLMEIKSRELLPVPEEVETPEEAIEDPRSELVRQLIAYRQLKDKAACLEACFNAWDLRRSRGMQDPVVEEVPVDEAPVPEDPKEWQLEFDLYELYGTYERLMRQVLKNKPPVLSYEGEPMDTKLERIENILKVRPFVRFRELIYDARSRQDIAMTFVALLELVRRRTIRWMQERNWGPIDVGMQSEADADALAQREADEAQARAERHLQERAARERELAAEAFAKARSEKEAAGELDESEARKRAPSRLKFDGMIKPEDLEEIDAEEAEIARRIDAILAAADEAIQRFEESKGGTLIPTQPPTNNLNEIFAQTPNIANQGTTSVSLSATNNEHNEATPAIAVSDKVLDLSQAAALKTIAPAPSASEPHGEDTPVQDLPSAAEEDKTAERMAGQLLPAEMVSNELPSETEIVVEIAEETAHLALETDTSVIEIIDHRQSIETHVTEESPKSEHKNRIIDPEKRRQAVARKRQQLQEIRSDETPLNEFDLEPTPETPPETSDLTESREAER